jgi:hypothetical protein
MAYDLVIDYGIPYNVVCINEQMLLNELQELKEQIDGVDLPFLDIWIYDGCDQDITHEYYKVLDRIIGKK